MLPSDHFVRFYNEAFKFLDAHGGLEEFFLAISHHQERHCLELCRKGIEGMYEYYLKIRKEENCGMEMELKGKRFTSFMTHCPSLSKVLDNDATPCPKYCDHCHGWSIPLHTKGGMYYVHNRMGTTNPQCCGVRTSDRQEAEAALREYLESGVPREELFSNLDDWEEVERNKQK